MNPEAILNLLSDVYSQLAVAQRETGELHQHAQALDVEVQRLRAENRALRQPPEPPTPPSHAGTLQDPDPRPPMAPARVQQV